MFNIMCITTLNLLMFACYKLLIPEHYSLNQQSHQMSRSRTDTAADSAIPAENRRQTCQQSFAAAGQPDSSCEAWPDCFWAADAAGRFQSLLLFYNTIIKMNIKDNYSNWTSFKTYENMKHLKKDDKIEHLHENILIYIYVLCLTDQRTIKI